MRFLRIDFLINDKLTQERELLSDLMGAPAPFSHDNNPFPAVFWMSLQCEKSRIEMPRREKMEKIRWGVLGTAGIARD